MALDKPGVMPRPKYLVLHGSRLKKIFGICQGAWIKLKAASLYSPSEIILQGFFYHAKNSYEERGTVPLSFYYNPEEGSFKIARYDGSYHIRTYVKKYLPRPDGTVQEQLVEIDPEEIIDVFPATPAECKKYGTFEGLLLKTVLSPKEQLFIALGAAGTLAASGALAFGGYKAYQWYKNRPQPDGDSSGDGGPGLPPGSQDKAAQLQTLQNKINEAYRAVNELEQLAIQVGAPLPPEELKIRRSLISSILPTTIINQGEMSRAISLLETTIHNAQIRKIDFQGLPLRFHVTGTQGSGSGNPSPTRIGFYNKDQPHYSFTNFYQGNPISLGGNEWKTSEHYFQAMKFDDPKIQQEIWQAPSARDAFKLARQYRHLVRVDWNYAKEGIMHDIVLAKFSQDPKLKQELLDTGNAVLVEESPHDPYWGVGPDGSGQNKLGEVLMEVREKIRQGHQL